MTNRDMPSRLWAKAYARVGSARVSSGPPGRYRLEDDPRVNEDTGRSREPTDVTSVFSTGQDGPAGHEQVVFCQDPQSGLRAIIAIYSTALGPALGGTRFYPYASEDAALADVLNLSRAMAYKNALAGLDLGGGKAVIIGDPAELKSEALASRLRPVRPVAERPLFHCL